MTSEETSWLLICRAISGDISPDEQEELDNIFLLRPDLLTDYENLKNLQFKKPVVSASAERRALDAGIEKFGRLINNQPAIPAKTGLDREYKPEAGTAYYKWVAAASIITLIIGSVVLYGLRSLKPVSKQNELVTHFGNRVHEILPDGSVIWLNSGSSVKYAKDFAGNSKREVTLNGEAYFDVKHDIKHPFIVHAGKLSVVVLGTAFNVKAYATDSFTETTLIRGKVEILMSSRPGMNIMLLPNQKVTLSNGKNDIRKTTLPIISQPLKDSVQSASEQPSFSSGLPDKQIDETAWIDDRLIFKHEAFSELALQLERWYNIKIVFDNQKYQEKQFTGKFKGQDIKEVMRALQFTQPFNYAINNNQIHIW